jgi:AraC-like DNA-binding protein
MVVNAPSLLLYSRPLQRQFLPDAQEGTNLVCADLYFHGGANNPIVQALPDMLCLPLDRIDGANPILPLLFDEAFGDKCGRRVLVDRLFEVVLIHVLRHLMEEHQVHGGMLAGLSHPKLRKALTAMHEHPANAWSLQALADTAGMSRSLFAETFRRTVGCTPGAYLQSWRVRLAQQALQQGQPLKVVAAAIGYGSEAALSRAFKSQCGMTPREWRAAV